MATLLETMSLPRLFLLAFSCFLTMLVVGLLGGLLAPDPTGVQSHLVRYCDTADMPDGPILIDESVAWKCRVQSDYLRDFTDTRPDNLVMWTQFPHNNSNLTMSRWHQFMVSSLHIQLDDNAAHQYHAGAKLWFEATLAYKDHDSGKGWQVMKESLMSWDLSCVLKTPDGLAGEPGTWECDEIPFFELGSLHHDYYLVNLRLPTFRGRNQEIGTIEDVTITAIHQNGGFTKIFLSIKTVMANLSLLMLSYYLLSLHKFTRTVKLLQKAIIVLGLSTFALNFPIEWFSLWVDMPGMLLWSDIRQGFFFAQFVLFLIIFMGEHCADDNERNSWKAYAMPIVSTGLACGALLMFDLSERGRQLFDPFYSVWSTDTGRYWGVALISLATLAIAMDVLYLLYLTVKAVRTLRNKVLMLPNMDGDRKNFYKSQLRRVTAICVLTVLMGIMTVIMFAIMNYSEVNLKWEEFRSVNLTTAPYFVIYAMWNCYALTIMLLYAPQPDYIEGEMEPDDKQKLLKNGPMVLQLAGKAAQE